MLDQIEFILGFIRGTAPKISWIPWRESPLESQCLPRGRDLPSDHNWGLLREMLVKVFPRVPVPQLERPLSLSPRPRRHPLRLKQVPRCPRSLVLR